jgi:hypothetical protein
MAEPEVWVFFYGSFINREVLARGGFVPDRIEVARLSGFDILVETLATLVRSDRHCVYGIVCQATHGELRGLYGQDWLGGTTTSFPRLWAAWLGVRFASRKKVRRQST